MAHESPSETRKQKLGPYLPSPKPYSSHHPTSTSIIITRLKSFNDRPTVSSTHIISVLRISSYSHFLFKKWSSAYQFTTKSAIKLISVKIKTLPLIKSDSSL
jgi:hypothetical protein